MCSSVSVGTSTGYQLFALSLIDTLDKIYETGMLSGIPLSKRIISFFTVQSFFVLWITDFSSHTCSISVALR